MPVFVAEDRVLTRPGTGTPSKRARNLHFAPLEHKNAPQTCSKTAFCPARAQKRPPNVLEDCVLPRPGTEMPVFVAEDRVLARPDTEHSKANMLIL